MSTVPTPIPPMGWNVLNFGAKPEFPQMDNTAFFQRALDAAAAAGGGTVWVPPGRYWFRGFLTMDHGVTLAGVDSGPRDPMWSPALKRQGPTLLPTGTTGEAFITTWGTCTIEDLIIYYPNQVKPDAPGAGQTGPKVYPPTILCLMPTKLSRLYLPNSYIGISIRIGRVYVDACHLGCYKNDVIVDNALDVVRISNTAMSLFHWLVPPQPLDFWTLNNGTAILSKLCDQLTLSNLMIFNRHTGISFQDPLVPGHATNGFASNVNLDNVRYGVVAKATNKRVGFMFSNLVMGPAWDPTGEHAIWLQAGAVETPRIVVVGGSIRNHWKQDFKVDAGELSVSKVIGHDLGGRE